MAIKTMEFKQVGSGIVATLEINQGIAGPIGPEGLPGADLTSYADVEALDDYPEAFPPDLSDVLPSNIGAIASDTADITDATAITNIVGVEESNYPASPDASTLYIIIPDPE